MGRDPRAFHSRHVRNLEHTDRLLVFDDAICSFNSIYTQGMTVIALEVTALCESRYHSDEDLSRRFFDAAARIIEPPKPAQCSPKNCSGQ